MLQEKSSIYLAIDVDSVGVQSIGVCVIESLSGGQTRGSSVAIAKIVCTGTVDTVGVSFFVEDSGGLVLSVAGGGESRKLGKEDGAVSDVAGRRDSVSQDIGRAAAVLVIAVGGGSGSGAAAVTGNRSQAGRDCVLR